MNDEENICAQQCFGNKDKIMTVAGNEWGSKSSCCETQTGFKKANVVFSLINSVCVHACAHACACVCIHMRVVIVGTTQKEEGDNENRERISEKLTW